MSNYLSNEHRYDLAKRGDQTAISSLIEENAELKAELGKEEIRCAEFQELYLNQNERANSAEAERDKLRAALEELSNGVDAPEYHDQGMGCGIEDRDLQEDGYGAARYGWDDCAVRTAEWIQGVAEAALKNGAGEI